MAIKRPGLAERPGSAERGFFTIMSGQRLGPWLDPRLDHRLRWSLPSSYQMNCARCKINRLHTFSTAM